MIDYQSIPLHIRCTQRYLIDPTYPGDSAWYKQLSEMRYSQESLTNRTGGDRQKRSTKFMQDVDAVADRMRREGPLTGQQMRANIETPFNALLNALNTKYLLYQDGTGIGAGIQYRYGILEDDDD